MLSASREYGAAVGATIRRDWLVFTSYRMRLASQLLGLLFSLTMFYFISRLVRVNAVGLSNHYYAFAVIGIVIMSVLTASLTASQLVRAELMQGNFERVMVSPLGPIGGIVAVMAFPILYAVALAAVMLGLAAGIFGIPIDGTGVPLSLVVAGLGTAAFAGIGLLFVSMLLAFKSSLGATGVIAGLSLLGGAYFPVALFPGWIRWVSDVQPFTPTVDLLRHLLIGTPALQPEWLELMKLGGFTAVLVPLALSTLRLAIRASRRRGTILEY